MTCGDEEKTILLFYGELDGCAKDVALGHLRSCMSCRAAVNALEKASACLKLEQVQLPAGLERLALERAAGARTPGFFEAFAPGWRQAAGACTVAAGLLAGFVAFGAGPGIPGTQSGLEDGLDIAQYGIYRLQEETSSLWQADFEYDYAALEDERERLDSEVLKGEIYES